MSPNHSFFKKLTENKDVQTTLRMSTYAIHTFHKQLLQAILGKESVKIRQIQSNIPRSSAYANELILELRLRRSRSHRITTEVVLYVSRG